MENSRNGIFFHSSKVSYYDRPSPQPLFPPFIPTRGNTGKAADLTGLVRGVLQETGVLPSEPQAPSEPQVPSVDPEVLPDAYPAAQDTFNQAEELVHQREAELAQAEAELADFQDVEPTEFVPEDYYSDSTRGRTDSIKPGKCRILHLTLFLLRVVFLLLLR